MNRWRHTQLGECADWLSGGTPFKGNPAFWTGSIPWVSAKDMKSFRLHDVEDHISESAVGNGGKVVPAETILLLVRGMTLHNDVPICVLMRSMAFNQDIKALCPKPGVNNQFLAYWLLAHKSELLAAVDHAGHGTGRLHTDLLKKMSVHLPLLPEQEAIAKILGTLDDKIELNKRMNATLEAMARALFQSWFVDFDVVRAKSEGRMLTGLNASTAHLFPDHFRDSEIGQIPQNWEAIPLYNTAKFVNGAAFRSEDFCTPGDGRPVVKIAELKDGISAQTKWSQKQSDSDRLIDTGDLVYSWSGSPDTSLDAFLWTKGPGLLNQHIFKVIVQTSAQKRFVFYLLKYLRPVLVETARNKQTTGLGHVTVADMKRLMVCCPNKEILSAFDRIVGPMFDRVFANTIESQTLAALRDTLLPKLLSGELRTAPVGCDAITIVSSPCQPSKEPTRKATGEFVEAVVIAQLVRRIATREYPLGRMRYNKLAYLAHRKADEDVTQHYLKKAAGPYSPWAKYSGPEKIAQKNGYIKQVTVGVYSGLISGDHIEKIDQYLPNYPVCAAIDWVVDKFRFRKKDDLELLATVDFAALDLLREGQPVAGETIKHVIAANKEWAPKLDRAIFSDESVDRALAELTQLFPATYPK